jgi:hypothetical protein
VAGSRAAPSIASDFGLCMSLAAMGALPIALGRTRHPQLRSRPKKKPPARREGDERARPYQTVSDDP